MRLFLALPLPEALEKELLAKMNEMKEQGMEGRFVPQENLHITLLFLGEQSPEDAEIIEQTVDQIEFEPFDLELDAIGTFGALYYAGLKVSENLEIYVQELKNALRMAGISFDNKKFKPHITLVRKGSNFSGPIALPDLKGTSDTVILYESRLTNPGSVYIPIESWKSTEVPSDGDE